MLLVKPLFALVALVSGAMGVGDEKYDLVWKPKADQVSKYALSMEMRLEDKSFTFSADYNMKVKSVAANGDYEIETSTDNVVLKTEDGEQKMDKTPPSVQKYNAKGEKIASADDKKTAKDDDDEDSNPFTDILKAVTDFTAPDAPAKVGDKWTRYVEPDEKKGVKGYRNSFELKGLEKLDDNDVLRVKLGFKEASGAEPATAEGAYYLSSTDFLLLRFEATIENFRSEATDPPGTIKLKLVKK